jgi:ABC-2 type transport system permease protein
MWQRIWTLFIARNREFFRDKSALGWNFLFPFLVILGFSLVFNQDRQILYKVGYLGTPPIEEVCSSDSCRAFSRTRFIEFVSFSTKEEGLQKLKHHRIDFLLEPADDHFWVSETSPKGYIVERLFQASLHPNAGESRKQKIEGAEIPYVEWLFPGILGMNMMFSALFGVGYVVVRYRKNGVLKRISVTPVRPWEFLTAQIISRIYLLFVTTLIVYVGCTLLFGFTCRGSYTALLLVFLLGGFSMISLGLVVASRSSSEEFAGGILNLISWPMMFLSEVWFSLEGSRPWVTFASQIFPLTHLIDATRRIMNDGAGMLEVRSQLIVLALMSFVFLSIGSLLFTWHRK